MLEACSHKKPRFWWWPAGALWVHCKEETVQEYDGPEAGE